MFSVPARPAAAAKVPADAFLEPIRFAKPKYIMEDPMHRHFGQGPGPSQYLVDVLALGYPGSVVPVFQSSNAYIHIWQVQLDKLPISSPAK